MSYSIYYLIDLATLAEETRSEVRRTIEQVADAVSSVPPANPFWASIHTSVLQIDVAGYRLLYRVLPRSGELHVVEMQPLPKS